MPCARCSDASLYFRLPRLADNIQDRSALVGCPRCGTLYVAFPEVKQPAMEITEAEARRLFPGEWVTPSAPLESLVDKLAAMLQAADEMRWQRSLASFAARIHDAQGEQERRDMLQDLVQVVRDTGFRDVALSDDTPSEQVEFDALRAQVLDRATSEFQA